MSPGFGVIQILGRLAGKHCSKAKQNGVKSCECHDRSNRDQYRPHNSLAPLVRIVRPFLGWEWRAYPEWRSVNQFRVRPSLLFVFFRRMKNGWLSYQWLIGVNVDIFCNDNCCFDAGCYAKLPYCAPNSFIDSMRRYA